MGLDAFFWSTESENISGEVDFKTSELLYENTSREKWVELFDIEEIAYWRKNWDLHEFLAGVYKEKGGEESGMFNCTNLLITEEILQEYESRATYEDGMEWRQEEDKKGFEAARKSMRDGYKVFYNGWY
jgi:hypothetical protein